MVIGFGREIKKEIMSNPHKLTPEILVPKIGDYLVEKGVLKPQDLENALKTQREMRARGLNALLGQVLVDLNLIDQSSLDQAITEQILQLRTALQDTNQQLERRVQERTNELQVALKHLSELNQLKTNIIANVSHEFRTPLTHIKGYLELLVSEALGPVCSDQMDALNVMQNSSERLEELIDGLIQFSMASQGELSINLSTIETSDLLQMAYERASVKANMQKVTLSLNMPPLLPSVNADREKITWVILQLLDNAIKFSPEAGHVILSAQYEGNFVNISVTDNGIGIAPDRIPELFEPFHQLDGSSTRRYGGTGLGLALVKQIIEAHGSIIRVSSKLNQGTRFDFLLPANNLS